MKTMCTYSIYQQIARVSLPGGEEREFEITPMADAAVRGYLEIIEVIVENGGQINAINEVRKSFSLPLLSLPLSSPPPTPLSLLIVSFLSHTMRA